MASSTSDKHGLDFDFGTIDWDHYEAARPPYSEELYDLIYQYHSAHGGSFEKALDVGAGGGIVSAQLLKKFPHVTFSDAGEGYVSQARERFAQVAAAGRMDFLLRKFNELDPKVDFADGHQADLITAACCIHFADPDTVVQDLGKSLRSGGTVAIFSYGVRMIFPTDDDPAQAAMDRFYAALLKLLEGITGPDVANSIRTLFSTRYGTLFFDEEIWKDVYRLGSMPNTETYPMAPMKPATLRIRPTDKLETVRDDFISKVMDYERIVAQLKSFYPGIDIATTLHNELADIKRAMGDREVLVKWHLIMVLATKK